MSYNVPSFHGSFGLSLQSGEGLHSAAFRDAAGTVHAHEMSPLSVVKSMAAVSLCVLTDDAYVQQVRDDFEQDRAVR